MNDKITFPRLSTMLADRSGRSKRFSEDFLREFFSLISESLEAGESVKVKGLGTFRLSRVEPRRSVDVTTGQPMEISGHSKVVFVPAKELAEAVNAPFEAFTAIEISDDADLSQIFTKDEIELREPEDDFIEPEEETEAPVLPSDYNAIGQMNETEKRGTREYYESDESDSKTPSELQPGLYVAEKETQIIEEAHEEAETAPEEAEGISEETETALEETGEAPEEAEGISEETETTSEDTEEVPEETEEAPEETETTQEEYEEVPEEIETDTPHMQTWVKTLLISLGAAVVALIVTFAVWYVFATNNFNGIFNKTASTAPKQPSEGFVVGNPNSSAEPPVPAAIDDDTIQDTLTLSDEADVPTAPSDALVYDTISTTRYLTTMAKEHYGNYNLWPYIYEENKAILGHPDRIRPGTAVVIPKLSKFGIDPTNNDDVERAKKMGVEIYARYGKKI